MSRYLWIGFFACELWFLTLLRAEQHRLELLRPSPFDMDLGVILHEPLFDAFVMGQPLVLLPMAVLFRDPIRQWEFGGVDAPLALLYLAGVSWFWRRFGGAIPLSRAYLLLRLSAFLYVWNVGSADWSWKLSAWYWFAVLIWAMVKMGLKLKT